MSTRCVINFGEGSQGREAKIYRHCDGYPDGEHGVVNCLRRFCDDVEAQTGDHRYGDPSYLAAKFVVWQARENASDPEKPLDFISLGVIKTNPGDIEYEYFVFLEDGHKRPSVRIRDIHGEKGGREEL